MSRRGPDWERVPYWMARPWFRKPRFPRACGPVGIVYAPPWVADALRAWAMYSLHSDMPGSVASVRNSSLIPTTYWRRQWPLLTKLHFRVLPMTIRKCQRDPVWAAALRATITLTPPGETRRDAVLTLLEESLWGAL